MGFSGETMARELGVILLICTLLYAAPRTAVFGGVLLTGYLGGAVAAHLRIGSPLFTHILSGVYAGVLVWGGLYLRDARLRDLSAALRKMREPRLPPDGPATPPTACPARSAARV
jgi:hypothetical protein